MRTLISRFKIATYKGYTNRDSRKGQKDQSYGCHYPNRGRVVDGDASQVEDVGALFVDDLPIVELHHSIGELQCTLTLYHDRLDVLPESIESHLSIVEEILETLGFVTASRRVQQSVVTESLVEPSQSFLYRTKICIYWVESTLTEV